MKHIKSRHCACHPLHRIWVIDLREKLPYIAAEALPESSSCDPFTRDKIPASVRGHGC
jgi:hypothetical protein